MKLSEFEKTFQSRSRCAQAFGVTPQQITTWIYKDRNVAQLADGRWIILSKFSVISKFNIRGIQS
jgi:hypothetical protein